MSEYDKTVNRIIEGLTSYTAGLDKGTTEYPKRINEITALTAIMDELKHLRVVTTPIPKELGDLSDIPPELLKELHLSTPSELETQIINIIKAAGGTANINTILVELFRRYGVKQKRRNMQNKLWRMTTNDILWNTESKGFYTTEEPEEEEEEPLEEFLGIDDGEDEIDVPF